MICLNSSARAGGSMNCDNCELHKRNETLHNVLQAVAAYMIRAGRKNDCLSFCNQYLKYVGNMLAEYLERAQACVENGGIPRA